MATSEHKAFEYAYKGAVALNNYGVTLLEHHCYKQAALTLRDSLQCLKSAHHPNERISPSAIRVDRYLQACFSRLANPLVERHSFGIFIRTIAGVQTNFWVECPETARRTQHFVFNPIRIEESNGGRNELELNAAIIVYDFAIASWCVSKTNHHSVDMSKSLSLFKLSSRSLDGLEMECEDEEELRAIVTINGLLVTTILRVFDPQDFRQLDADEPESRNHDTFNTRLDQLKALVQSISEVFPYLTETLLGASAA